MAKIRITRELLEHLLDLPEGVEIIGEGDGLPLRDVEGTPVICFYTSGPAQWGEDGELALQYEETEVGTSLVSAIPVPD